MRKLKLFQLVFLLSSSSYIFSQGEKVKYLNDGLNKCASEYKNDLNFNKTARFFIEKNWDSTLIYSAKQSDYNSKASEVINYKHYCRGYSFYEKRSVKRIGGGIQAHLF